MSSLTIVLLIVFHIKHWVSDFVLQRSYMLQKNRPGWDFALPLASHCAVHFLFTLVICLYFAPHLWWLAIVDFFVHFAIDRLKDGPRYLGRFRDNTKAPFWICLGFDQMLHHFTHIYFVYVIVTQGMSA